MKILASLLGLLFVLALPQAASADSCSVPGHPNCSFTCPGNQVCEARWVSTYGGACSHRCLPPKPPTPQPGPAHPGGVKPSSHVIVGKLNHEPNGEIVSPRDPQSGLPTGRRMHKPMVLAQKSGPCRSEAFEREDAEQFCKRKLECEKGVRCQGEARRWICRCV